VGTSVALTVVQPVQAQATHFSGHDGTRPFTRYS
jgi:hypothetical protein